MKFLGCPHIVSSSHLTDQLRQKGIISPRFRSNSVPFSRIRKSEAEQASWRGLDVAMLTRVHRFLRPVQDTVLAPARFANRY
jgi:hypothetical protein